jgi:hypothetical protein
LYDKGKAGHPEFMPALPKNPNRATIGGKFGIPPVQLHGEAAEDTWRAEAAMRALNGWITNALVGTGALPTDPDQKGSVAVKMAADTLFPGVVHPASNAYARKEFELKQKAGMQ